MWNIELENSILLHLDGRLAYEPAHYDRDGNEIYDKSVKEYKGHRNAVTCIATFCIGDEKGDGVEFLLTAGYEGTINIWECSEKKS